MALNFCEIEGTPNPGRSLPHWPLSMVSNASTLLSSLNVSSNSNLNNLNVSGITYFNDLVFAQSNLYTQSILPGFDPAIPNKSIIINTRGSGSINLLTSSISTIIINRNNTSIMSSLNVSGSTTLNNSTTINSSLNVVGDIIHQVYQYLL